jgi:hypothetical protein
MVARANRVGRGARARATKDGFVRARPGRFATAIAGIDSSWKGADDTSTVAGGAVIVPRERASSSRWAAGMTLAATKTTTAARASPFAHTNAARRIWTSGNFHSRRKRTAQPGHIPSVNDTRSPRQDAIPNANGYPWYDRCHAHLRMSMSQTGARHVPHRNANIPTILREVPSPRKRCDVTVVTKWHLPSTSASSTSPSENHHPPRGLAVT